MIPLITLEEHFFAKGVGESPLYGEQFKHIPGLLEKLKDLGPIRLQEMEKGKISMQIISHGPGLAQIKLVSGREEGDPVQQCIDANNQLAEAMKANSSRFKGFATLPMGSPLRATEELRRTIRDLGFLGALIDNHADGRHYDGSDYRCFWEMAQKLDVPIYLHPTWPDESLKPRFEGNFPPGAAISLGASGFGWHADTGLHVLKLFASGLFDEFPKLKLVIGHMGEMLPFMLERIEVLSKRWGERQRDFGTVWRENIWITTSGCWSVNPMATILRNTPIDHILYSVDYPFAKNEDGLQFMEDLRKSGLVDEDQFEMIGYSNAERLFRITLGSAS